MWLQLFVGGDLPVTFAAPEGLFPGRAQAQPLSMEWLMLSLRQFSVPIALTSGVRWLFLRKKPLKFIGSGLHLPDNVRKPTSTLTPNGSTGTC
jgi:hypothetical protein